MYFFSFTLMQVSLLKKKTCFLPYMLNLRFPYDFYPPSSSVVLCWKQGSIPIKRQARFSLLAASTPPSWLAEFCQQLDPLNIGPKQTWPICPNPNVAKTRRGNSKNRHSTSDFRCRYILVTIAVSKTGKP